VSIPGSLRIERPYDTTDAYLEGDAWTVGRADMLLVGAESLAAGTLVRFEIVLTNGDPVVCGEGRAVETVEARDGRQGGLRIRFRQLDPSSKAMLRRALEVQKSATTATTTAVSVAAPPEIRPAPAEQSGVRHRALASIVAPVNRDALLGRLRARAGGGG
jgi:hypothetical protein